MKLKSANGLPIPTVDETHSCGGVDLVVVMPFYNEEGSLAHVVSEWADVLRAVCPNYEIILVADKPTDNSLGIARDLMLGNPRLLLLENPHNVGHGQSCLRGYLFALSIGAEWILQVDSDGQCDPRYFPTLWENRQAADFIQAVRIKRCDGWVRWCASRLLECVVFTRTGKFLRDPNCPYRLMKKNALSSVVKKIPPHFDLVNVAMSYLFDKQSIHVKYFPIVFLGRHAGVPTISLKVLIKKGARYISNLFGVC